LNEYIVKVSDTEIKTAQTLVSEFDGSRLDVFSLGTIIMKVTVKQLRFLFYFILIKLATCQFN